MKRLDELLERISEEDSPEDFTANEIEFFEKLNLLRHENKALWMRYILSYNEVVSAIYQYDEDDDTDDKFI